MKNRDNIRAYSDLDGEIFLAPKGSTLPTEADGLADPVAPFQSVGWITDAGVEEALSTEVKKSKAWQGGSTVRVRVTSTEKTLKFAAMEETPFVTALYYDHDAPVVTGTGASKVARVDLPDAVGTVERAAVVKYVDGGVTKLHCIPLIQISERGTVVANAEDETIYEFTSDIVGASYWLTNNPAYLGE